VCGSSKREASHTCPNFYLKRVRSVRVRDEGGAISNRKEVCWGRSIGRPAAAPHIGGDIGCAAKFETAGVRRGRSAERVAAPALVVDRQIPVFHIASQGAEMTGSLLANCLAKKLQAIAISLNSLAVNVTRLPNW